MFCNASPSAVAGENIWESSSKTGDKYQQRPQSFQIMKIEEQMIKVFHFQIMKGKTHIAVIWVQGALCGIMISLILISVKVDF